MNRKTRALLFGASSVLALGLTTAPSQAEQQVFKFYVNTGLGTGKGNHYKGPACDRTTAGPGGVSNTCLTFATTSSQAGAFSEASSIGIGTQGHAAVDTLDDAFDGYGGLNGGSLGASGSPDAPIEPPGNLSYDGLTVIRQTDVTHGPGGLADTTAITAAFTSAGVANAGRQIAYFTNSTGSTIDTYVSWSNNLGSDSNTKYFTAGPNNTFVTSQQICSGNPPTSCSTDPTITAVLGNNAYTANNLTIYHADGDDNPQYTYHIVVAPGKTVAIATFVILTGDVNRGDGVDADSSGLEDAVESDIALGASEAQLIINDPTLFFADLSAAERAEILNFQLATVTSLLPNGATVNERNVATAIDYAMANDGAGDFSPLLNQSGGTLEATLDQFTGEGHAEAARSGFDVSSAFLGVMLDPMVNSRGGVAGSSGPSLAFAPVQADRSTATSLSLAQPTRVATPGHQTLEATGGETPASPISASAAGGAFGLWMSGYGQITTTDGDSTVGSHNTRTTQTGFAGGADFRPSDHAVFGLAFGYAHAGWRIPGVDGSGQNKVLQGGGYGSVRYGGFYLSGAVSYSNYDVTSMRTLVFGGTNRYASKFSASGFGGRVEAGDQLWNIDAMAFTPYVAFTGQAFDAPTYAETTVLGSSAFAQTVAEQGITDTNSELGIKMDANAGDNSPLTIHATLAWAHDFSPNLLSVADFTAFTGSTFAVHGAPAPADAALVSVGLDGDVGDGFNIGARLNGKFSGSSTSYGGTGVIQYHW